jgi:enoyl-CoA hydratase/carnithine racemase
MDEQAVKLVKSGGVALIRMNRDARDNRLDMDMRLALADAFNESIAAPSVRVIVISGGPRIFAAGADLALIAAQSPSGMQRLDLHHYWRPIQECPKPLIAAVSGLAAGAGAEMALMADIIIADPTARIAQPECRLGVVPGAGGAQRLIRTLGKQVASLHLMTGRPIDAERAYQLGLVAELAPAGEAEARAMAVAAEIAAAPALSPPAIKRMLALGADLPLESAIAIDQRQFLLMFDTKDQKEGMAAAMEGRRPRFIGR